MKNKSLLLIKANLINSYSINRVLKAPKNERIRMSFVLIAIVFLVGMVLSSITGYYIYLSNMLMSKGQITVLLTVAFLLANMMCFFASVFTSSSYLFAFKDFQFLVSLPLTDKNILFSKLFLIYFPNTIMSVLLSLPAIIIFGINTSAGFTFYALALLGLLIVPIIPIVLGATISLIIGRFASQFKQRNLVLLIASFLLIIIMSLGSYFLQGTSIMDLNTAFLKIGNFQNYYFPAKLFVKSLSNINLVLFISFIAINVVVFVLFLYVFSKNFKKINLSIGEHSSKAKYKMSTLKVTSSIMALYKKELKSYFSCYVYILNTMFGLILFAIYLISVVLFKYENILKALNMSNMSDYILPFTTVLGITCVAMSCTTGSSLSIEGANLWIIKSLPLKFSNIAKCKIMVNLTLTIPFMFIASFPVIYIFKLSFLEYIAFLAPVLGFSILSAIVGLIVNLYFPKFDWKSEVQVIKQSIATAVTLMANIICVLIPVAICFIIKPSNLNLYFIYMSIVVLAVCIVLWNYIKGKGSVMFKKLEI